MGRKLGKKESNLGFITAKKSSDSKTRQLLGNKLSKARRNVQAKRAKQFSHADVSVDDLKSIHAAFSNGAMDETQFVRRLFEILSESSDLTRFELSALFTKVDSDNDGLVVGSRDARASPCERHPLQSRRQHRRHPTTAAACSAGMT